MASPAQPVQQAPRRVRKTSPGAGSRCDFCRLSRCCCCCERTWSRVPAPCRIFLAGQLVVLVLAAITVYIVHLETVHEALRDVRSGRLNPAAHMAMHPAVQAEQGQRARTMHQQAAWKYRQRRAKGDAREEEEDAARDPMIPYGMATLATVRGWDSIELSASGPAVCSLGSWCVNASWSSQLRPGQCNVRTGRCASLAAAALVARPGHRVVVFPGIYHLHDALCQPLVQLRRDVRWLLVDREHTRLPISPSCALILGGGGGESG